MALPGTAGPRFCCPRPTRSRRIGGTLPFSGSGVGGRATLCSMRFMWSSLVMWGLSRGWCVFCCELKMAGSSQVLFSVRFWPRRALCLSTLPRIRPSRMVLRSAQIAPSGTWSALSYITTLALVLAGGDLACFIFLRATGSSVYYDRHGLAPQVASLHPFGCNASSVHVPFACCCAGGKLAPRSEDDGVFLLGSDSSADRYLVYVMGTTCTTRWNKEVVFTQQQR
mmetsp:Transcript_10559/g.14743  ORF Transcript_10559/g.14743 Transcript_10559/m.14743 type:complete len:225 (+) Transcript_10559:163-837(+)